MSENKLIFNDHVEKMTLNYLNIFQEHLQNNKIEICSIIEDDEFEKGHKKLIVTYKTRKDNQPEDQ